MPRQSAPRAMASRASVGEVETLVEEDRLDAHLGCDLGQAELRDLAAARPRVAQQHGLRGRTCFAARSRSSSRRSGASAARPAKAATASAAPAATIRTAGPSEPATTRKMASPIRDGAADQTREADGSTWHALCEQPPDSGRPRPGRPGRRQARRRCVRRRRSPPRRGRPSPQATGGRARGGATKARCGRRASRPSLSRRFRRRSSRIGTPGVKGPLTVVGHGHLVPSPMNRAVRTDGCVWRTRLPTVPGAPLGRRR